MSEPFVGQLNLFSCGFAPTGWALCNGQLLKIAGNQLLFSLLGTQYGGDGATTFGVPNLPGRVALGAQISGLTAQGLGTVGGEAAHTLGIGETPVHTHTLNADASTPAASNQSTPVGNALGQGTGSQGGVGYPMYMYMEGGASGQLDSSAVGTTGGQPHSNMMPSLGLNYCIALTGIFPSRS